MVRAAVDISHGLRSIRCRRPWIGTEGRLIAFEELAAAHRGLDSQRPVSAVSGALLKHRCSALSSAFRRESLPAAMVDCGCRCGLDFGPRAVREQGWSA